MLYILGQGVMMVIVSMFLDVDREREYKLDLVLNII